MTTDDTPYQGPERRRTQLDAAQIEIIAERAAEKAMEKLTGHIYQEVGKGVLSKLFWLIGASAVGVGLWLKSKNLI